MDRKREGEKSRETKGGNVIRKVIIKQTVTYFTDVSDIL